jgi:3-deoxy-D-manno-octulosonic-acid transferase
MCVWWIALPFLPLKLWWRGRREPGYRLHIGERFGRYRTDGPAPVRGVLWIHAVSLGETRAAAPLIDRLRRERPDMPILLTHMTATGREAGRTLYGEYVLQAWLPYDAPFAVRAFLARFAPRAVLLMETEVWPNLVAGCEQASVPLFLVNARLSARSLRGYHRVRRLSAPMFAALTGVAAQTDADAQRLAAAGARRVAVIGNVKFDAAVPEAALAFGRSLRARLAMGRPVWIAASTREGEEALLLDALARATLPPRTLTIIVPRHPQRFDAVASLLSTRKITFARRSEDRPVDEACTVLLGDSLGELLGYYAAADVAFVGGSLLPLGGQNLLEAIAVGTPTLVGPHTFNFEEATASAVAAGAALRVPDADTLLAEVARLLADEADRARLRAAASEFHAAHRGAADRLWAWLAPQLPGAQPAGDRRD